MRWFWHHLENHYLARLPETAQVVVIVVSAEMVMVVMVMETEMAILAARGFQTLSYPALLYLAWAISLIPENLSQARISSTCSPRRETRSYTEQSGI